MENLILGILNIVLTIGLAAGGIVAYKAGFSKTAGEVQARVIDALESELTALKGKVDEVKEENNRLDKIIITLIEALKSRGLIISVDGTLIKITDNKDTIIARIVS